MRNKDLDIISSFVPRSFNETLRSHGESPRESDRQNETSHFLYQNFVPLKVKLLFLKERF